MPQLFKIGRLGRSGFFVGQLSEGVAVHPDSYVFGTRANVEEATHLVLHLKCQCGTRCELSHGLAGLRA